ncbi:MAG: FlgD immunoglobulin-like domain containing protein [Ignavibacteria bacterium]|jgi:hypothetical protein
MSMCRLVWICLYVFVAWTTTTQLPLAAQSNHAPLTMPRQRVVQSCGAALVTRNPTTPFSLSTIVGLNAIGTFRSVNHRLMLGFWIPIEVVTSVGPESDVVAGARVWTWPNPFRDNLHIEVTHPLIEFAHADIYNNRGSIVNSVTPTQMRADGALFTWDGLDAEDNPVANGIYTVRVVVQQFYSSSREHFSATISCNR